MSSQELPRVFVSYSHQNVSFAEQLTTSLNEANIECWIDFEKIYAGRHWYREVEKALDGCDIMILVVTPDSMHSEHVENEWQYYLDVRKPIVPVILQSARMPFQLRRIQYVDFENVPYNQAFESLLVTLQELYEEIKTPPSYDAVKSFELELDDLGDIFPDAAGIRRVYHEFPFDTYRQWLTKSLNIVRVFQTWLPVYQFRDELITAAENGANLQILLIDPNSPFARQRSRDLGHDEQATPDNIWTSLHQLSDLCLQQPGLMQRHLEVRLYNSLPTYPVLLADHRGFVGFFPHSLHSLEFPMLEIRTLLWDTMTPFGRVIAEDFQRRWEQGRPFALPIEK